MVRESDPSTGMNSLFSKTIQTSPANHQSSYLIVTGVPSQGYYGWIIKLTTPNLPVPSLRRSGAILLTSPVRIHGVERNSCSILLLALMVRGTRWRSWLRHYATSRKVTGSIPNGVGIFHWHNLSAHTMALGSTQPLTAMSTRNISWGVKAASA